MAAMTTLEMSQEFDILAQSYLREGGFTVSDSSILAFNEYEKSLYLTREQEKLVIALYSGAGSYGGFELTEQLRRDLETLLKEIVAEPDDTLTAEHVVDGSQFFALPSDLWYIVYEAGRYADSDNDCPKDTGSFPVEITPVTYDTLHRIKGNPFRGPNKRRALRLDKGKDSLAYVEIVPKNKLGKYYVKYIRRPDPIILADLGDVTINGGSMETPCKLHESLHRIILEAAVASAVNSRVIPNQDGGKS